jgi:hypothetical protein
MFPRGLPGVALLLLRVSVSVAVLIECYGHRNELPGWIQAAAWVISIALFVGFLTPIVALTGLAFHGLIWLGFDGVPIAFMVIRLLDVVAVTLLGPGAYSMDAYRFGRRRVVLPLL